MRSRTVALAAMLAIAPLAAKAADLVVWWERGYYAQEDEAVREIVAAFEQETGKQVELVFQRQNELPQKILAALDAGRPPDFAFGVWIVENVGEWAFKDRLVDLSDAVGHFSDLFDSDALDREVLRNGITGQKALYALPMANSVKHVHVWEKPPGKRGLHACGHSSRMGGILVVLVRSGATGRAPGHRPRRHLGCRTAHVGHGRRYVC
jgi:ABC-type glycerol-3-phosphate transport system substrate-binding protein